MANGVCITRECARDRADLYRSGQDNRPQRGFNCLRKVKLKLWTINVWRMAQFVLEPVGQSGESKSSLFSGHHVQTRPLCFEIVNLLANIFHSILVEHVGCPTACLYTLLLNLRRILLETLRPTVGLFRIKMNE
jgi:hypothetical protein